MISMTDENPKYGSGSEAIPTDWRGLKMTNLQSSQVPPRRETEAAGPAIGAARLNWNGDDGRG